MAVGDEFRDLKDIRPVGSEVVVFDQKTIPGTPGPGTYTHILLELPLNAPLANPHNSAIEVRETDALGVELPGPVYFTPVGPLDPLLPGTFVIYDPADAVDPLLDSFRFGRIRFNLNDAGRHVKIVYTGRGSLVSASDVVNNSLGTAIVAEAIKPGHISADPADDYTFPGDVQIDGDLNVAGVVNKVASEVLDLTDDVLFMNQEFAGPAGSATADVGLEVNRAGSQGDAANPTLQWNETSDTWEFTAETASNIFNLGVAGLGLGTNDPQQPLHIVSTTPVMRLQDADGSTTAARGFIELVEASANTRWRIGSVGDQHLTLDSAGNDILLATGAGGVGIANADPLTHKLLVTGTAAASAGMSVGHTVAPASLLDIRTTATGDVSMLRINGTSGFAAGGRNMIAFSQSVTPGDNARFGWDHDTQSIQIRGTSDLTRLAVHKDGNVGIGIESPGGLTHWLKAADFSLVLDRRGTATAGSYARIAAQFNDEGGTPRESAAIRFEHQTTHASRAPGRIEFWTGSTTENNSERMALDQDGNLQLIHSTGDVNFIIGEGTVGNDYGIIKWSNSDNTFRIGAQAGQNSFIINTTGQVGVLGNPNSTFAITASGKLTSTEGIHVGTGAEDPGTNTVTIKSAGSTFKADSTSGNAGFNLLNSGTLKGSWGWDSVNDRAFIGFGGSTHQWFDSFGNIGINLATSTTLVERVEINGAIKIGAAAGTADGVIRYAGGDFEGRKAGVWTSLTAAGGGGEVNDGTQLGTGTYAPFAQKNGLNLEFRELIAGTNVTMSQTATGITINSTGGGTPGGVDTQVQYNDGGSSFGGASNFVFNDGNGNVGIGGATDAADKLRVTGQIRAFQGNVDGRQHILRNNTDTEVGRFASADNIISGGTSTEQGFKATGTIKFASGGSTERMRIDAGGNVGIGGAHDSTDKLKVTGVGQFTAGLTVNSALSKSNTIYNGTLPGASIAAPGVGDKIDDAGFQAEGVLRILAEGGGGTSVGLGVSHYSNSASLGATTRYYRARGTVTSPASVQSGDVLGELQFTAYAGKTGSHGIVRLAAMIVDSQATSSWVPTSPFGTAKTRFRVMSNTGALHDALVLQGDATNTYARVDTLQVTEKGSSPGTPDSGYGWVYGKTDGDLYYKNDAGTETNLTGSTPVVQLVKVTKTHTQFQTAGLTNDIEIWSAPAGAVIKSVKIKHSAGFVGTSITSYKVGLGITGDFEKYATAFEVEDTANPDTNTTFQISFNPGSENHGAATSIRSQATAVGNNLDQSSAGSVDYWIEYMVMI